MVPQIGKREQNRADKRARITAAARALFTAKGFDATTMREVARSAGVASGTVFTYASTKNTLLILVFHDEMLEVIERGFEGAMALEEAPLVERVVTFFDALLSYHEQDLNLASALMRELGHLTDDAQRALVAELMRTIHARLAVFVEHAIQAGEVAEGWSIRSATRSIFAIYYIHLIALVNGNLERAFFESLLRSDIKPLLAGLKNKN